MKSMPGDESCLRVFRGFSEFLPHISGMEVQIGTRCAALFLQFIVDAADFRTTGSVIT
jgi:hypothetical protein